ncbi:CRISPR-associated endonuclease Cas1 [Streptomyces smyrnaeus]|uniref:CRISPR-associated endonuclease Cas1 n=1 Tax=Streptomyces smyrnaeus TaxID=1387713 RepID=A0ABS3Y1C9_9ACTN|nr:CRISPR-associated endonuclease Cas1 [Streptomyces smyrnaeus]MBO8200977.1 CRISPR-associated endonuclease Cas1 [Streptomyces smyrnaeus]
MPDHLGGLRRNSRQAASALAPGLDALTAFAAQAAGVSRIDELRGVEGTAARLYFERFTAILCPDVRETFAAVGPLDRSRRPPRDPLDALLPYCHALLANDLTATCCSANLFHAEQPQVRSV